MKPRDAVEIQNKLRSKVAIKPFRKKVRLIAGFDLSYLSKDEAIAGAVLFSWPNFKEIDRIYSMSPVNFPYISGLLSFREMPALLKLWKKIRNKPDLLFIDGQGIAHPRGLGIASHFGITVQRPTIGTAKSRLVGSFREPGKKKGSGSPLYYKRKMIGAVLRTRENTKPIFVSPGHMMTIKDSVKWTMRVTDRCRIPEPTRQADIYVNKLKAESRGPRVGLSSKL